MFIVSKNTDREIRILRIVRDRLLAATDFYYLSDTENPPHGVPEYRQALRDCTSPKPGQVAVLPDPRAFGLPPKLLDKLDRVIKLDIEHQP
jgi:hypothetical protein